MADRPKQLGGTLGVDASVLQQSLEQAQKSLTANQQLIRTIHELKEHNPTIKLIIMSNISLVNRDLLDYEQEAKISRNTGTLFATWIFPDQYSTSLLLQEQWV
jgi:tryptophan synthase alpha subunit